MKLHILKAQQLLQRNVSFVSSKQISALELLCPWRGPYYKEWKNKGRLRFDVSLRKQTFRRLMIFSWQKKKNRSRRRYRIFVILHVLSLWQDLNRVSFLLLVFHWWIFFENDFESAEMERYRCSLVFKLKANFNKHRPLKAARTESWASSL